MRGQGIDRAYNLWLGMARIGLDWIGSDWTGSDKNEPGKDSTKDGTGTDGPTGFYMYIWNIQGQSLSVILGSGVRNIRYGTFTSYLPTYLGIQAI